MRGYTLNKGDYQRRLRRLDGQVRGLQRMIDEDAYCIDVLTQTSAITHALHKVALGLLAEHIRHCVTQAAADDGGSDAGVTEAMQAIDRLIRS